MSQLPLRSIRLRSYTSTDLDRLTGEKGEIFYDQNQKTLKIYNGAGVTPSVVNIGGAPSQLKNGNNIVSLAANGNLTLPGNLILPVGGDVKNSSGQGIFDLLTNYVTSTSLGSTLNSYVLKNTGVTGDIFTNLIDSVDSSAITVTPSAIFSSDVTVENNLNAKNIVNNGQQWSFNEDGVLAIPEGAGIQSETSIGVSATNVDAGQSGQSGLYAEVYTMLYAYEDVVIRANNNGTFKDWTFDTTGNLNTPGNITTSDITAGDISSSTVATTNDITVGGNVNIDSVPTAATHATNKRYVDKKAIAMSIAMS
jgi:hypothetical protein